MAGRLLHRRKALFPLTNNVALTLFLFLLSTVVLLACLLGDPLTVLPTKSPHPTVTATPLPAPQARDSQLPLPLDWCGPQDQPTLNAPHRKSSML